MDRQSELYILQDEVKRLQIECKSKGDYIRELMCLFDSARDLIEQINLVNYTDDNGDSIKNTTAYKRLIKALDNF